jgi:hypothetical protein
LRDLFIAEAQVFLHSRQRVTAPGLILSLLTVSIGTLRDHVPVDLRMGRGRQQNQEHGTRNQLFHTYTSLNHLMIRFNVGYSRPVY